MTKANVYHIAAYIEKRRTATDRSHFTVDQQKALSFEKKRNTLVSAAAGSGKTTVLIERILRRLEEEFIKNPNTTYDIRNFLLLTFSTEAAASMKNKLFQALQKEQNYAQQEKDSSIKAYSAYLELQCQFIHAAHIQTISSFCLWICETYGARIGYFGKINHVTNEQLEEFVRDHITKQILELQEERSDMLQHIERLFKVNHLNFQSVSKELYTLYRFYEDMHEEKQRAFQKNSLALLTKEADEEASTYFFETEILPVVRILKEQLQTLNREFSDEFHEKLYEDLEVYQKIEHASLQTLQNASSEGTLKFSRKRTAKKDVKSDAYIEKERTYYISRAYFDKKVLKKIKEITSYSESEIAIMREIYSYFFHLFDHIQTLNTNEKKQNNQMTFRDYELNALQLLQEEDIAATLQKQFLELYIDEFQDTSEEQYHLLQTLGTDNVFKVGDIKQCIYVFRDSKPQQFSEIYTMYDEDETRGTIIDLQQNFRSSKSVLQFTNFMFEYLFFKATDYFDYDEKHQLVQGNDAIDGSLMPIAEQEILQTFNQSEVHVVCSKYIEKTTETTNVYLQNIIEHIKKLMFKNVRVMKNEMRQLTYNDIAILAPSRSILQKLKEELDLHHLPNTLGKRQFLFESLYIREICSYFRFLFYTEERHTFLEVLRSTPYQFTEDELLILARSLNGLSYEHFKDYVEHPYKYHKHFKDETDDEIEFSQKLYQRICRVVQDITKLQVYRQFSRFDLFLDFFLEQLQYFTYVQTIENQNELTVTLDAFRTYLHSFEETHGHHFIQLLQEMKYKIEHPEYGNELTLEEVQTNAIHLMTIHASKGLEFPVVYLIGLDEKIVKTRDTHITKEVFNFSGAPLFITDGAAKKYTVHRFMQQRQYEEERKEKLRLLYVALTRAEQKIILFIDEKNTKGIDIFEEKQKLLNAFQNDYITYRLYLETYNDIIYQTLFRLSPTFYEGGNYKLDPKATQGASVYVQSYISLPDTSTGDEQGEAALAFETLHSNNTHQEINIPKKVITYRSIPRTASPSTLHQLEYSEEKRYSVNTIKKASDDGTAFHRFMGFIFLRYTKTIQSIFQKHNEKEDDHPENEAYTRKQYTIAKEVDDLLATISKEDTHSSTLRAASFLKHPMTQKLFANVETIKTEYPFTYRISARELDDSYAQEESVMLHGIMDLLCITEDRLILIDYKTNKVSKNQKYKEQLIEHYTVQLSYYARALEELQKLSTQQRTIEVYLYFTDDESYVEIPYTGKKTIF